MQGRLSRALLDLSARLTQHIFLKLLLDQAEYREISTKDITYRFSCRRPFIIYYIKVVRGGSER